jgi:hypothetical protein
MKQHPEIYLSPIKETKFFAFEPDNPEHVYADHMKFPVRTLKEYTKLFANVTTEKAIGEVSPLYLNSRTAAQQIYQLIPQVNLIFSLRNPVTRAYSAYWMRVRSGEEHRPPAQAFREDRERLRVASYYNTLQLWYELFAERQLKIILYEDFTRDMVGVMQELYRFLAVDHQFTPNVSVHYNVGGVPRSQSKQKLINYLRGLKHLRFSIPRGLRTSFTQAARANLAPAPAMPSDVQALLVDLYREDIAKLQNLIHKDLSIWGLN